MVQGKGPPNGLVGGAFVLLSLLYGAKADYAKRGKCTRIHASRRDGFIVSVSFGGRVTRIRKCAENYSNRWRNGSHSVHSAIGIGMQLDFGCGADTIWGNIVLLFIIIGFSQH